MQGQLRGVTVEILGDYYHFGCRKYHKTACPASLKREIEKAVAAADPTNNKGNKRAKHSTASTGGNYGVSARGTQPRQRKN